MIVLTGAKEKCFCRETDVRSLIVWENTALDVIQEKNLFQEKSSTKPLIIGYMQQTLLDIEVEMHAGYMKTKNPLTLPFFLYKK